jgi:hypothetical protein
MVPRPDDPIILMYDARDDLHELQCRHNEELAQLRLDLEHAQAAARLGEEELAKLKPLVIMPQPVIPSLSLTDVIPTMHACRYRRCVQTE